MKATCARIGCGIKFEKTVPWKIYCSRECKFVVWSLKKLKELQSSKPKTILKCLIFMLCLCQPVFAAPAYSALADAIHIAENGPTLDGGIEQYGIHVVHYKNESEARAICIRTCKHAWRDHKGDYLIFLAKRYCPVNWKTWLKNVRFYYARSIIN